MEKLTGLASDPSLTDPSDDPATESTCSLCLKSAFKYTCPRCNVRYCSAECYKSEKHQNCSEAFYRDCFMEGLKESTADPEEKKRVLEMIRRAEEECPEEEGLEEEEDLRERMRDLDLENADKVWETLTEKEKQEFEGMVKDGRIAHLVEVWTPWWVVPEKKLVAETNADTDLKNSQHSIQKKMGDIPAMSKLLPKSKPSSDVKYNMVNVLYSYAFVCRLHNGDYMKRPLDSVQEMLDLSDVLGKGQVCGSSGEAIQLCFKNIQESEKFESSLPCNVSGIKDVLCLIKSSSEEEPLDFMMMALSELQDLFKKGHKSVSRGLQKAARERTKEKLVVLKKKIFQCEKKIEFLLSWTQSYGMAMLTLIPELDIEFAALSCEVEEVTKSKEELEKFWGGKVKPKRKKLIEEL